MLVLSLGLKDYSLIEAGGRREEAYWAYLDSQLISVKFDFGWLIVMVVHCKSR